VGRARAGALALLGALIALAAVWATSATAALPPLQTGVSYVLPDEEPEVALKHVREAGAQLALDPLRWSGVAPEDLPSSWNPEDPADPNYSWGQTDRWVQAAAANGLIPVLQIRSAPAWAQRCPPSQIDTGAPCNPDPAALAAFATAAARRYNGQFAGLPQVHYWQGLNEPNLSLFFNPQYDGDRPVSPDLYRVLINSFYAAVKAVDPSNLVLAAGLGPIAVPKYTIGPMRFTRLLLCMSGGKHPHATAGSCEGGVHFDIFDIHPYTTGGPTHEGGPNDVEIGDLAKLTNLLRAADSAGRIKGAFHHTPLWITEFAWDSKPPDPGGLPIGILNRWTAEAMHEAWSEGIDTFFWFSLRDSPAGSSPYGETLQSGLYYRGPTVAQDVPKPVVNVFRFPFVAYPGKKGMTFWGRTPSSSGGKVIVQALRNGHWRKLTAVRADEGGIFRGRVQTGYGRNHKGKVRAHYRSGASVAFGMRNVPDFIQPPFGTE
jgi:hypothetical protein